MSEQLPYNPSYNPEQAPPPGTLIGTHAVTLLFIYIILLREIPQPTRGSLILLNRTLRKAYLRKVIRHKVIRHRAIRHSRGTRLHRIRHLKPSSSPRRTWWSWDNRPHRRKPWLYATTDRTTYCTALSRFSVHGGSLSGYAAAYYMDVSPGLCELRPFGVINHGIYRGACVRTFYVTIWCIVYSAFGWCVSVCVHRQGDLNHILCC